MKRLDWASGVPAGEEQEPKVVEEEIYVGDGEEVGQESERGGGGGVNKGV